MSRMISVLVILTLLLVPCGVLAQHDASIPAREEVNGRIIEQDLYYGQGHTIIHVWGSHYDMGYAHGYLLAEWVELGYQEITEVFGVLWPSIRATVAGWTFLPEACEDECLGILDGVRAVYPETDMDVIDIKAVSTYGDWAYNLACRSTCCWADVVEPPFTTLSVRKLQFSLLPPQMSQQWHHVICAWEPNDGTPAWVNFAFPGWVTAVTGINEFGTTSSLHDWNSNVGPDYPDALPRTMACRYALTMDLDPDPMTHLTTVFDELSNYEVATGGFINYYVPDGGAGVIKTAKSAGFYDYRIPQASWMDGEVISTNNSDITGTTGISPWVSYYTTLDPEGGVRATMEGLWDTGYQVGDYHMVELGYRGADDMTIWFTGRLQSTMLDRVEMEWEDLFRNPASVEQEIDARDFAPALRALPPYPNPAGRIDGPRTAVTIPILANWAEPEMISSLRVRIHDIAGRQVLSLVPEPAIHRSISGVDNLVLFEWNGIDAAGRSVAAGVYPYIVCGDEIGVAGSAAGSNRAGGRIIWLDR